MLGSLPAREPNDAYWEDRFVYAPALHRLNALARELGANERFKNTPVVRALRESADLTEPPWPRGECYERRGQGVVCTFCRTTRVPPGKAKYASTCTRCTYCAWCDAFLRARCGGEYACVTRAMGATVNGTEPPCGIRRARLERMRRADEPP